MFHPTARRLDEPYKLYGFTVLQWVTLLVGGGAVVGGLSALDVGVQLGGFLGTLLVGSPALYWLLGQSGRIDPAELLFDALRRGLSPRVYAAGPGDCRSAVLLIDRDGEEFDQSDAEDEAPPW